MAFDQRLNRVHDFTAAECTILRQPVGLAALKPRTRSLFFIIILLLFFK
jgi:hypothetical protein